MEPQCSRGQRRPTLPERVNAEESDKSCTIFIERRYSLWGAKEANIIHVSKGMPASSSLHPSVETASGGLKMAIGCIL